jgi:predicted amidohydrolase
MITVAAVQYCASDDAAATLDHIYPLIADAARTARLVTLPEAATYLAASRTDLREIASPADNSVSQNRLAAMAREFDIWLLAGSLLLRCPHQGQLVNRSLLIAPDGAVAAHYDKIHMFDADVGDGQSYRESHSFTAGTAPVIATVDSLKVGLSICYDVRFPHLYRQLATDGAQLIMVPAAFTATSGAAHWHVLLRARAIETGCFIVAPAQSGVHADGRHTYGHSLIIGPWGDILADAGTGDATISATIDPDAIMRARRSIPSLGTNPPIGPTQQR